MDMDNVHVYNISILWRGPNGRGHFRQYKKERSIKDIGKHLHFLINISGMFLYWATVYGLRKKNSKFLDIYFRFNPNNIL